MNVLAYMYNICGYMFNRIVISATGALWSWWLYGVVALFFGMMAFFCIGMAFMWRPSVRLTPERLRVRDQSGLGWRTREFAAGADVVVRRACRNDGGVIGCRSSSHPRGRM